LNNGSQHRRVEALGCRNGFNLFGDASGGRGVAAEQPETLKVEVPSTRNTLAIAWYFAGTRNNGPIIGRAEIVNLALFELSVRARCNDPIVSVEEFWKPWLTNLTLIGDLDVRNKSAQVGSGLRAIDFVLRGIVQDIDFAIGLEGICGLCAEKCVELLVDGWLLLERVPGPIEILAEIKIFDVSKSGWRASGGYAIHCI